MSFFSSFTGNMMTNVFAGLGFGRRGLMHPDGRSLGWAKQSDVRIPIVKWENGVITVEDRDTGIPYKDEEVDLWVDGTQTPKAVIEQGLADGSIQIDQVKAVTPDKILDAGFDGTNVSVSDRITGEPVGDEVDYSVDGVITDKGDVEAGLVAGTISIGQVIPLWREPRTVVSSLRNPAGVGGGGGFVAPIEPDEPEPVTVLDFITPNPYLESNAVRPTSNLFRAPVYRTSNDEFLGYQYTASEGTSTSTYTDPEIPDHSYTILDGLAMLSVPRLETDPELLQSDTYQGAWENATNVEGYTYTTLSYTGLTPMRAYMIPLTYIQDGFTSEVGVARYADVNGHINCKAWHIPVEFTSAGTPADQGFGLNDSDDANATTTYSY